MEQRARPTELVYLRLTLKGLGPSVDATSPSSRRVAIERIGTGNRALPALEAASRAVA